MNTKTSLELLFAFCLFATVRSIHARTYILTASVAGMVISSGIGLTAMTTLASNIYEASKIFKHNFCVEVNVTPQEKQLFVAKVKACRHIRCNVGGLYFIERSTKLKGIDILIDMAATLLLNF